MSSLTLLAPAKINLCLHILDRRKDGYHNLSMLMEKVSLCDEIILEKISEGIQLVDSNQNIPQEKNLVFVKFSNENPLSHYAVLTGIVKAVSNSK